MPITRMKLSSVLVALPALAILAILLAVGCSPGEEVEKMTVTPGPFEARVRARGEVRAANLAQVFSEVDGQIIRLMVSEGDRVSPGQVLAVFDVAARRPARQNEIAAASATAGGAEAAYRAAQRELERLEGLLAQGAIPSQQVEGARAEADVKRSAYLTAKANLDLVSGGFPDLASTGGPIPSGALVAPREGVVLDLPAKEGMIVPRSTVLMAIGNPARLEIIMDVAPSDLPAIKEGQEVSIFIEAGGPEAARGKVQQILPQGVITVSPLGVKQSRAQVKVAVTEGAIMLKPGYQVENEVIAAKSSNALVAPDSAIFEHKGSKHIFLVKDGRARIQPVRVGGKSPGKVEIVEGLNSGDIVISRPGDKINDGDKVR